MSISETVAPSRRLYLSPPDVRGRERQYLLDALESNWIAPLGPHVDAFEEEICAYLGGGHAAALSSGTGALHLALLLLGVGKGDTVLCSTFTFVATANAIRYVGGIPVFVDSNSETWNLCPKRLEEVLAKLHGEKRLPKALICVDLYGHAADYDAISAIAAQYGVPIIEDAAEALGASHGVHKAGRLGAIGVFSFNGNKIITTSGGGMLVSDNEEWVRRARHLATQARMPVPHYEHQEVGYNYRLSNLLASVGRAQLETLDERIARRKDIRTQYRLVVESAVGLQFMPQPDYGTSNCWLTCLLVDEPSFGASRDQIIDALASENIESRPLWKPMHRQPAYASFDCCGGTVAEDLFRRGLCLPSGSSMSDGDVQRVCEVMLATGKAP